MKKSTLILLTASIIFLLLGFGIVFNIPYSTENKSTLEAGSTILLFGIILLGYSLHKIDSFIQHREDCKNFKPIK